MKKVSLKKYMKDISSDSQYQFSVSCQVCGKPWISRAVPFSKAGMKPETEEKKIIYNVMYQREMEAARDLSVQKGKDHFNLCPICGKLVCDDCFMICEDLDMCIQCSILLKESGKSASAADGKTE
ncbi:MAG: hypothetical protein ACI4VM_08990 [Anaerovoracaceae bacterium]